MTGACRLRRSVLVNITIPGWKARGGLIKLLSILQQHSSVGGKVNKCICLDVEHNVSQVGQLHRLQNRWAQAFGESGEMGFSLIWLKSRKPGIHNMKSNKEHKYIKFYFKVGMKLREYLVWLQNKKCTLFGFLD